MIYACKQFCSIIHGTYFTVVTDHASLRWRQLLREPEGRLARWSLKMQAYNYTILHRHGSKRQNADGLSRLLNICGVVNEADRFHQILITGDFSQEDKKNQTLLRQLHKNTMVKDSQL